MKFIIGLIAALAFMSQAPHTALAKDKEQKKIEASKEYKSPRVRALDANDDDKITLEEFLKEHVDQFSAMDADKDKTLSPDEVDFPPGTPDDMKVMLRKRMQEDEARMEQMRVENEKRRAEDRKKMEAEQEARQLEAEKAAKADKTEKVPSSTEVKPDAADAVALPAAATATAEPATAPAPVQESKKP